MTNQERIDNLAHNMIDGWLNGEGKAPSFTALCKARRWVRWLPRAGIFPTPEGGILYEYSLKHWCLSIEFEATGLVTMMAVQVHP